MKTTSYIVSKQLAEIGFEAEADKWVYENPLKLISPRSNEKAVKSFCLETILEAFKGQNHSIRSDIQIKLFEKGGGIIYTRLQISFLQQEYESLADTAARLLILLYEKGLIKF